jgi:hypothetical protein
MKRLRIIAAGMLVGIALAPPAAAQANLFGAPHKSKNGWNEFCR